MAEREERNDEKTSNVAPPDSFLEGSFADLLSDGINEDVGLEFGAVSEVGHYRLIREVGRGGFGVVYEAESTESERPANGRLALKLVHLGVSSSEYRRFQREVSALQSLSHPSIVSLLDSGTAPPNYAYLVMPLIDGVAIDVYCEQTTCSWQDVAKLMLNVCLAIEHAHSKGVTHCDLKPSNILVTNNSTVTVTDFGLSRFDRLAQSKIVTLSMNFRGTPAYMAPEQIALSSGQANDINLPTIDVYGLGATFFKLLTGDPPRPANSALSAIVIAIAGVGIPKIQHNRLKFSCPHSLLAIVEKAIDPKASVRYASVSQMREDLENAINSRPVVARRATLSRRLFHWTRQEPILAAVISLLFISLVLAVSFGTAVTRSNSKETAIAPPTLDTAIMVVDDFQSTLGGLQPGQRLTGDKRREILTRLRDQRRKIAELQPGNFRVEYDYAQACFVLGEYLLEAGERQSAADELRIATKQFEILLANNPHNLTLKFDMFHVHFKLGTIYHAAQLDEDGQRHYVQSRILIEQLVSEQPGNIEYLDCLAAQLANSAMYEHELNDPDLAMAMFGRSLSIAEQLRDLPRTSPRHWRHRLDGHWGMERIHLHRGEFTEAVYHAQQAVKAAEEAVAIEPESWVFRLDLLRAWTILATAARDAKFDGLILQALDESERCAQWLTESRPDHEEVNQLLAERERLRQALDNGDEQARTLDQ